MQRRRAVSRKQNRRVHALITLIFCIAVFILVCAGCFLLVKTDGTITNKPNQSQGDSSSAAPDGADSTTDGDSQQEQPTMTEEEQRIADATSTASANCTKDAPQVVDPALWDERGKALMEQLAADEFYQSEGLKYSAKDGCPYMIAVNRAASTVTVLALDDEGNYTKPYMAMVCSGGADTPLGFFATPVNYDWRLLAELWPVRYPHLGFLSVPHCAVLQPAQGRYRVRPVQPAGHPGQPGLYPAVGL